MIKNKSIYLWMSLFIFIIFFASVPQTFTRAETECSSCVDLDCWELMQDACNGLDAGFWDMVGYDVTAAFCYSGGCQITLRVHCQQEDIGFNIVKNHTTNLYCFNHDCWDCESP